MQVILVVDNDSATLLMLKEEFQGAGYEVLITDSGEKALGILNNPSQTVNLIITNLRHDGPQGLEFIRLIKKARSHLPVICFTSLFEYQELPPDERPFDVLVEKSSDLTKLKDSVDKLLGKKE